MKKLFATLFGVLLVLNVLAPASFADEAAQEGEAATTTPVVTEGTTESDGTLKIEFETLVTDINAADENILRDVASNEQGAVCTKSSDGSTTYANGNALWYATNAETDPSTTFSFKAETAGYYKVRYMVGNIDGDTTNLSKMTFTVNGTVIGDNNGKGGNNTVLETLDNDQSQWKPITENKKTIYVRNYPWRYEAMSLFEGTAFCYLEAGTNTLKVDMTKTGGNVEAYKFFADYIDFIPVGDTIDVTQVSTGDYMTRLTPELGLGLQANTPVSFAFTVPKDGDYAFMAKRNVDYSDGKVTATVTGGSLAEGGVSSSMTWNCASWAKNKLYARIGVKPISLKANENYTLTVESAVGFIAYYFDIIRTDIDVDGKIVIPGHYYTDNNTGNDHYLHCREQALGANAKIAADFSDYAVIGSPTSDELSEKLTAAPLGNALDKPSYHVYTLNIPKDGKYAFNVYVNCHNNAVKVDGKDVNYVYSEPVYFTVDAGTETAVQYTPATWDDRARVLHFEAVFGAGQHTLKIARKQQADTQNSILYIPFLTAEPVNSAMMYQGSVASENIISSVQDGTLVARIQNLGDFAEGDDVMAFFAIYDDTKQMVAVASYLDKWPSADYVDLTITNFAKEAGRTYQAKALLWNSLLQGESVTLASFPLTTE